MGNVHVLANRVTALSMACVSTVGLIFGFLGGFSCNFLAIHAQEDRYIFTPSGQVLTGEPTAYIGVQCDTPFFEKDDRMWNMSQIFLYISIALGCLTTILAWTLGTFVSPNRSNWRILYILAACTAVLEVPIFLMFESQPCTMDVTRQTCSLGVGGYFQIVSVTLFVMMTLWTQYVKPPDWAKEANAWRTESREVKLSEISIPSGNGAPRDGDVLRFDGNNRPYWSRAAGHEDTGTREVDSHSDFTSASGLPTVAQSQPNTLQDIELGRNGSILNEKKQDNMSRAPSILSKSRSFLSILSGSTKPTENIEVGRTGSILNEKKQNDLKSRSPSLLDRTRSYLSKKETPIVKEPHSIAESSQTSTWDPSTKKSTAGFTSMCSTSLGDNAGFKLRIMCPDGTEEHTGARFPTCADGSLLLEDAEQTLAETADFVYRTSSKLLHKTSTKEEDNILRPDADLPEDEYIRTATGMNEYFRKFDSDAPIPSIYYDEITTDGVSEVTPAFASEKKVAGKCYDSNFCFANINEE